MAKLLIRTVKGENSLRYDIGDVVEVFEDSHVFGRMECLETWLLDGRAAEDWPGGFSIIQLEGMSVEDARELTKEGANIRRVMAIEFEKLERRSPESGRDTLRTQFQIKRQLSDPGVADTIFHKVAQ